MSRYEPLRWHLAAVPADQREVRMSFRDVEALVGTLPASARNYRPWWANSESMPQAVAWQRAGFVVDEVNLTAELVVFARGRAQRRAGGAPVATRWINQQPLGERRMAEVATDGDHSEDAVQARLVTYLTARGWRIHRVADTAGREQGVDVLASKDGRTLAVEVKGYPSHSYADPRRATETKPTSPSVQARHWFAAALLKAVLTHDEHPGHQIAIALPDVPTYRSLQARTRTGLGKLGIITLFVSADGSVSAHPGTRDL